MPYFHSAINVFKLLLLSSGFDICSLLAKNRGENIVDMYFFFCHFRRGQWNEIQKPHKLTAAVHSFMVCPAFPLLPSWGQQRAGSPNRGLPLGDYNLWSISIIGGVCRDSYSNNYLNWTVSKATTPPSPLPNTQTVTFNRMSCSLPVHSKEIIDF